MSYLSILKFINLISITLGAFFSLELLVGLIYSEDITKLAIFLAIFIVLNAGSLFWLRGHKLKLGIKESILSVNLLWLVLGFSGALPLYLYTNVSFASAFFEAISGFTTTGSTVYTDIESLPYFILFHRSLMHWLGGMGIIVLGVGLLSIINPTGSLSLFKAESTGVTLDKLTPKIKDTALILWGVYFGLTLLDTLFLKLFGMNWFDAINHAFSTISTGGFSTKNSSLGYFNSYAIYWVTTLFMLLSGINFLAHVKLFYRDTSGYKTEEFRWYVAVFLTLALSLTFVYAASGIEFDTSMTHSFFTVASVMTTTGFATTDYSLWGHFAIGIIFIAMLIGGNTGSTAGGIKIIRYLIIFKTLIAELKRIVHPSAHISVFIDKKKLSGAVLTSTFGFFFIYVLTTVLLAIYIYAKGYDTMTSVSGSLALVGNIGPGFGAVGPANNFAQFSDIDKIVFSIAMIIGRLEFYTVFVLLSREFWKKF
jgi:trk system potassium uptake protein TrkH